MKRLFIDSFRDVNMNQDLAREIKNEIQAFQHNVDITTFRLSFDAFCVDLFESANVYNVNKDLEEKDKACLYLAYTYVMIEVTGNSVLTSLISKLISSEVDSEENSEENSDYDARGNSEENSEEKYLTDIAAGFLKVQEFQLETDRIWLRKIFEKNSNFICGAFRFTSKMWNEATEKQYALIYIGSIDRDLRTYIEDFPCHDESDNSPIGK